MGVPRHLKMETPITPTDAVRALRQLVIEANWSARRIEGTRLVDRFAIIIPLASASRTIGLVIDDGPLAGVAMESYGHTQGSAGRLTIVEWLIPNELESEWRILLAHWATRLPRCPWRWSFRERSTIGFLLPVWRRARTVFRNQGIPVSKGCWPDDSLPDWPPKEWSLAEEE